MRGRFGKEEDRSEEEKRRGGTEDRSEEEKRGLGRMEKERRIGRGGTEDRKGKRKDWGKGRGEEEIEDRTEEYSIRYNII